MSNASDYAKNYFAEKKANNGSVKSDSLAEWLYSDWDEKKYKRYLQMDSIPILHERMDYLLGLRADQEYFAAHGLSYSDIHDPRNLPSYHGGRSFYGSVLNFVSSNIKRLY